MPIPRTRAELIEMVTSSFTKLVHELEKAGPGIETLHCVDDWNIKDLLARSDGLTDAIVPSRSVHAPQ